MNHGRPLPLHGQTGNAILEYRAERRRALADGQLTPQETGKLIRLADRLAAKAELLVETDEAVCAALAGKDGIRSERFQERVKRATRARVIALPADLDLGPNQAA